jgi:hypothetical protein
MEDFFQFATMSCKDHREFSKKFETVSMGKGKLINVKTKVENLVELSL